MALVHAEVIHVGSGFLRYNLTKIDLPFLTLQRNLLCSFVLSGDKSVCKPVEPVYGVGFLSTMEILTSESFIVGWDDCYQ